MLYFGEDDAGPTPPPQPQPQPQPDPPPDQTTPVYQLVRTKSIAGEMQVVGLDSDRAGGVWVAYRQELGGYWDNDDVRIVHLDSNGVKVSEWQYLDEHSLVTGLAFAGDALWLNYEFDNNHLRKIDPATGAVVKRFATEEGIVDVTASADGTKLVLSKRHNELITISTATGGEQSRVWIDKFAYSTQAGAAAWDNHVWVASYANRELALVDATGAVVGIGHNQVLEDWTYSDIHLGYAYDDEYLLMHADNQIMWLRVDEPIDP